MAKKKYGYREPADYFPPEIRKQFEAMEAEEEAPEEKPQKKNLHREQSKRLIEEARKKKAAKNS